MIKMLNDARIVVAQFDISTDLNQIAVTYGADMLPAEHFGATYHQSQFGLRKTSLKGAGYVQAGTNMIEDIIHPRLSGVSTPITLSADGGDAGEGSLFFKGQFSVYEAGGQVGELHKFNMSAENANDLTDNPLVRATILEDGKTSRTTASNTATYTLGAVASGQKLYAALHVLEFTGTDVTFKVRSAVTDFATITDRITFTQVTGLTSEYGTPVAGPITDTFWRVYWTTSGGFTSFKALISVGIQ